MNLAEIPTGKVYSVRPLSDLHGDEEQQIWWENPAMRPMWGFGRHLTPIALMAKWKSMKGKSICGFHGGCVELNNDYACFSNFFDQSQAPFTMCIPPELFAQCPCGKWKSVTVSSGEMAIMLCKAAVMGDMEMFEEIALSTKPQQAKRF